MRNIFKQNTWRRTLTTKGFTIIEMLVVLGLIALFSTMITANYSNFRQTTNLKGESEKLTSLVRKAQLWALTGQTRGGVRPPGGWGVHIETCSTSCRFFLFADMSDPPDHIYNAGDAIVTEVFTQQHVQVASVQPNFGINLDLVFTSPTSSGYINGEQIADEAVIVLAQANSNEQQEVTVYRKTNRILLAGVTNSPGTYECNDGDDNDNDGTCDTAGATCLDLSVTSPDSGCSGPLDDSEAGGDSMNPFPDPIPEVPVFWDLFDAGGLELTHKNYTLEKGDGWEQIYSVVDNNEISGSTLKAKSNPANVLSSLSCGKNDGALYQTKDVFATPNYKVQATFRVGYGEDNFGMIASRIQANGNMYLFQWDEDRGQLFLRYEGAWLQLGGDTAGVEATSAGISQVDMTVYGNRISVSKSLGAVATLLINEVDGTLSSAGSAGVGMGAVITYNADCDSQMDNFIVKTNISVPPAQCNDGLDNDGDDDIDFGSDGDCDSVNDSLEYAYTPVVKPEFYDDFNVTNDTLLQSRIPNIGSGWEKIISVFGDFLLEDISLMAIEKEDTLQCGGNYNGQGVLYQTIDTFTSPDYEVSVRYEGDDKGDDYVILASRIQSDKQMYAVKFNEKDATLRVKNGDWLLFPQKSCIGCVREGDTVTLKTKGSIISVLRNGTEILSIIDNTISDAGHAGIGMGAVIDPGDDCKKDLDLDDFKVIVPCDALCLQNLQKNL